MLLVDESSPDPERSQRRKRVVRSREPAHQHAQPRAESLGRSSSFRVVDVGGEATRGTESGIARAKEEIDEEYQRIPGWHPFPIPR